MTEEESEAPPQEALPPVSFWKLGVAVMMAGIIVFLLFILLRLLLPAKWEFNVEASTEFAEVNLPLKTETRWLIDGAHICTRAKLDLPEFYVTENGGPCGSMAWYATYINDPEQVLRLEGGTAVTVRKRPQGGYAMSLRVDTKARAKKNGEEKNDEEQEDEKKEDEKKESIGTLSVVGVKDDVDLGVAVNLIWSEVPAQSLIFPFWGVTTLGRTVSWSSDRLLQDGQVVVYKADESADKRRMVDEAALMLGDQVRLGRPEVEKSWAKGFVRIDGKHEFMRVVAFGRANSLRIERFGESGYDFRPGPLRKLAADPAIAFWGSILAAYMTLILSLQPFVGSDADGTADAGQATDLLKQFSIWLRRRPDR